MKAITILFMFLILMCLLIISNNNLAFLNSKNISRFWDLFFGWMDNLFLNFKNITGQAIGMDWGP